MQNFLEKFDRLAKIETENNAAKWLERIAFAFLILMILTAPHSIAASQISWLTGMFVWLIRLFVKPRPKFFRTALDVPLWAFFGWSVVSSAFSYAPGISFNKLRGTALFLIFYFVINNLRTKRAVRFLALALVASCMVNVVWVPIQRLIGRGVEIHEVTKGSPLDKAVLIDGDALLTANGKKLNTPEDLVREIEQTETTKVTFYRPDFEFVVDVKRENLLSGDGALERLGIGSWKKSRNWRSAGFFGHYATYAEVLQLILSLAFGLFIASFFKGNFPPQSRRDAEENKLNFGRISSLITYHLSLITFLGVALMCLALLLTVTRASQLAFLVSAVAIVVASGRRKLLFGLALIILPIAAGGLIFLQQSRNVGFFDAKDDSTTYRETMWRDGVRLWTSNARNFTVGVGMDSIQRYWREWNLYDGGRLPQGHFHSTPLQLLVERGLPALLLWLWIVGVYARTLWREIKLRITNYKLQIEESESKIQNPKSKIELGILLGSLGGLIGFFTSGLVHYNLGDQEVAMVFFILMGLSVYLCNSDLRKSVV